MAEYRHACRALIVSPEGDAVLLARRSEHDLSEPGKWDLLGGKVDEGETASQAVTREVLEEGGVQFVIEGQYGKRRNDAWLTDFFYGHAIGELQIDPDEHCEARFFTEPELESVELAFDHKDVIIGFLRSLRYQVSG